MCIWFALCFPIKMQNMRWFFATFRGMLVLFFAQTQVEKVDYAQKTAFSWKRYNKNLS